MDLSEIPHDQWDYSMQQLVLWDPSEEEDQGHKSISEHEILDVTPLLSQPHQIGGYKHMDAVSVRSVSTCLDNDLCQVEQEEKSITQLTLEHFTYFSDSTAIQEYETPAGTTSNCGLVETTPWSILQMEGSLGADIFSLTTFDSEYGTMGVSQSVDFPPVVSSDLYQVSLNEYLMYLTNAGVGTPEIPGSLCNQNDASLWTPPSQEYPGDPHLALINGQYAGEMEPEMSSTKEEENVQWSRKDRRKHQSVYVEERDCVQKKRMRVSKTREGTDIVQRRKRSSHIENDEDWNIVQRGRKKQSKFVQKGKRSSHLENDEDWKIVQRRRKRESQFVTREDRSVKRSDRVCRVPIRYIDECCKPKTRGTIKAKKAAMTASRALGSVASSSLPGSSMVHKLEDVAKTGFMSRISSEGNLPWDGIQETVVRQYWGAH